MILLGWDLEICVFAKEGSAVNLADNEARQFRFWSISGVAREHENCPIWNVFAIKRNHFHSVAPNLALAKGGARFDSDAGIEVECLKAKSAFIFHV
jgi:hypothetical protein